VVTHPCFHPRIKEFSWIPPQCDTSKGNIEVPPNIDGILDDIVPRKIYLHKISVCIESTFRWSSMIGRKSLSGDEKYSQNFSF
jgi:hypothetical protein